MKAFYTLFLTFVFTILYSQDSIFIGHKNRIFSQILNEERKIWVHLPKGYQSAKIKPAKYPVIYLLDTEINFGYFTGMVDFLSKEPYASMPEVIVVGIENTDRPRDFTPTKSFSVNPNNQFEKLFESSGGNENFLQFIEKELKPHINHKYRTDTFSVLVGHSFGGLAAINAFLHHPVLFDAYVANDPSLWWDQYLIIRQLRENINLDTPIRNKKFLFVSRAKNEEQNHSWGTDMENAISAFIRIIESSRQDFYTSFKKYNQEHHGTMALPANYDALKFIFSGYETDIKNIAKVPNSLMASYRSFSEKTGHLFNPSENYLNKIIQYCESTNSTNVEYFKQLKSKLYP